MDGWTGCNDSRSRDQINGNIVKMICVQIRLFDASFVRDMHACLKLSFLVSF